MGIWRGFAGCDRGVLRLGLGIRPAGSWVSGGVTRPEWFSKNAPGCPGIEALPRFAHRVTGELMRGVWGGYNLTQG